ncbi:hypothetical protein RGQ29_013037 [Quercus rubra]|uniref:Secreted protein n=1 Tax=Quercus rubra TaxID=3512 RepID=A0AAN7JBB5_QUERU|nr:hypothetical protein RGQ29_013037 [Quercus rubra]
MKRELLIWLFLIVSLKVLSSSSACTADNSSCKPEKQLKHLYDIQSREDDQRTYEANRGGHHLRISQKAKTVYGGTANLRPRNSRNNRNAANSLLLKSSSLFSVALRHVVLGLVISVFFF